MAERWSTKSRPLEERVKEKFVVDPSGCWLWTASLRQGYGQIGVRGRRGPALAHRVMWELTYGPIPEGLELDHLCRVRRCVNPDHLEPVEHRTNAERGEQGFALTGMCRAGLHRIESEDDYYVWKNGRGGMSRICKECRKPKQRINTRNYQERRGR